MSIRKDLIRECRSLGIPDQESHADTLLQRQAEHDATRAYKYARRGDEFLSGEEAEWYEEYKRKHPI